MKGYGVYDLTEVKFTVDFYPQAVGFRSTLEEVPDWVRSKKSISLIINDDDLCGHLYPNSRPKKKSRRSSGAAPSSPTGGDSSDSD